MVSPAFSKTAPEIAGFAPDLVEKFQAGLRSGLLRNVHAALVARRGAAVLEHYGAGMDEAWGNPLGQVTFGPETLHDLRSVTKSVVGLLYGIALERGQVPPPDAPLMAQFPEYPDLATDPARSGLTVLHALTMTMGAAWDELSIPYTNPANSEIAMEAAPDRLRFILGQTMLTPPGKSWTYSGGAVALIGALIARGTGMALPEFARASLFAPLGIDKFEWFSGKDGTPSAASGLRLRPRDLLAIGQLVLNGGQWQGRQVVTPAWISAATWPAIATEGGLEYGRLWFLGEFATPALSGPQRWIAGFGNGGQRLWLMPAAGLAMVSFSGAYNQSDSWVTPTRMWREIVLANLVQD